MGAKNPGKKGSGGGGNPPVTGQVKVSMSVADARVLLGSLATGTPIPPNTAKTLSLAVVRALAGGGGGKVKKKGKGKGTPKGKGKPVGIAPPGKKGGRPKAMVASP
jgi:hypothetical protein